MTVASLLTVLVLSVSSDIISSQYVPPSPCPDIFTYKREGQQVHGVIRYQPAGQMIHVFIRANFEVAVNVTLTGYAGKLDVKGSKEVALLKMLRGKALEYRVDFPLTDPLPSLNSIVVNGNEICTGHSDFHRFSQTFTLEHLLYDKGDGLSPIAVNFGNSENNRPISNTSPVPVQLSRPTDEDCGVVSGGNNQVGLVYYGTAVSPGDWPWLVAIFTKYGDNLQYICGGSLVSNQHVVTAGHCMSRKTVVRPLRDFILKVGAFNLDYTDDPRVSRRGVKAAALHTDYNSDTLGNDALLLQLDEPVVYTRFIRPICLWVGQVELNFIVRKHGSVVGWGGNEIRESGTGEPRVASIPIVSTEECRASRVEFHKLTTSGTTLCAGYRNGTGPCNGDSGSGLYMFAEGRWRLRGVVSVSLRPVTGEAKCNLDEYIVFTDVAQYLPWLQQHLQGQSDWLQTVQTTQIPEATNKSTTQTTLVWTGQQRPTWKPNQTIQLPEAPTKSSSELECGVMSGGDKAVPYGMLKHGRSSSPGDWPWLVAIVDKKVRQKSFICAGTLVSNQHVITAAHCQYNYSSNELAVRVGVFDLLLVNDPNSVTRTVKHFMAHPDYNRKENKDNIAIIKLDQSVVFTKYIRPICLRDVDNTNITDDENGVVAGWGYTIAQNDYKGGPFVTLLPIVPTEICRWESVGLAKYLSSNTFCSVKRNGDAPCNKDRGGGLYTLRTGKAKRWMLSGVLTVVLSGPHGNCETLNHIIFTDVTRYMPWLRQNLI